MEDNLEYIDAYFQQMLNAEEIRRFEQRITEDPEFANEVAFYLAAKQSSKAAADQEKKERFRELLSQQAPVINIDRGRNRRVWIYRLSAAASVIVCLFLAWYFLIGNSASPQQMADKYIDENLRTLPITMGEKDSLQDGLRLYNTKQYDSALKQFQSLANRDTGNYLVKEYLGIIYLRSGDYDNALLYFSKFENDTLYANPSLFYQALTLLKRNMPGDKQKAKELLQRVVNDGLDESESARMLLKKW